MRDEERRRTLVHRQIRRERWRRRLAWLLLAAATVLTLALLGPSLLSLLQVLASG